MTELDTAIWTKFNESIGFKNALTGGLHNTVAPQSAKHPYGVFQVISDVPRITFSEDSEDTLIQFKVFSDISDSSAEVNNLFNELKLLYDKTTLTITDYETISILRIGATKHRDENGIWEYLVLYRMMIEKVN